MEVKTAGEVGPAEILQAYRQATDKAGRAGNPDEEIAAYSKVIELGEKYKSISREEMFKYNMIMYWSYNNIADAWFAKSFEKALSVGAPVRETFEESLKYYQQGLRFAQDNLEKLSVLNRMADSYKQLGDEEKLCDIKKKVIANLNDEDKRKAYKEFADSLKGRKCAAQMYEEALNYINDEKVELNMKFQNTIEICEKLLNYYDAQNDTKNHSRILKLKENSQNLMKTCQKNGGCSF